ncbi:MAG: TRAP transporter substrate-binding protein DctP [Syntrophaceae bacterium]|nr:TRAP transporter substrate-binding protein DctP [Syntrophaceae bacterium]
MQKNNKKYFNKETLICTILSMIFTLSIHVSDASSKEIQWRMQDVATAGQLHYDWRTKFTERVKDMSGGRLVIKQYPSGALVKSSEMFESVANGSIQIAAAASPYWAGIVGRIGQMGWCIPFTYDNARDLDNFLQGPYANVMREVVAKHGVYYLGTQLTSSYPIISTKPIKTIEDLSKLKIRCVGLTAFTLKKIGARTVFVPAEEIYTGLATGVFDGVTWGGPSQTHAMGLHEVCKYYLLPAVSDVCYNECVINKAAWEKLPPDLKEIVKIAWDSIRWSTYKEMETFDQKYLKDYVANKGVTITKLPPSDVAKLRAASLAVLDEEVAKQDPNGKKLVELLLKDLKSLGYID